MVGLGEFGLVSRFSHDLARREWRSLAARHSGGLEVPSSNLGAPITENPRTGEGFLVSGGDGSPPLWGPLGA